jgi:hypothetical protein
MTEQVKISTREELLNNKSTNIYYNMETYNSDELIGIVSIKFCNKIKLTLPLPDSIENIEFECYFDSPIENNILPKNLKTLNLGWYFNKEITDQNLPESVEELAFGYWFNKNLFISLRNLKSIIVHTGYGCLVSPEIMNIMPDYYIRDYSQIVKNQITPEMCYEIDEDEDYNDEDKKINNIEISNSYNLNGPQGKIGPQGLQGNLLPHSMEIHNIHEEIKKHFDKSTSLTLDEKNVFINQKNQIVIDLTYSFWKSSRVVFVGNNDKFYKTYFSFISIPKPYRLYTNTEKEGSFSVNYMFKNLRDGEFY